MATSRQFQFAGIDVFPSAIRKSHAEHQLQMLYRYAKGEKIDPGDFPKSVPISVSVFVDESGDEFAILPTPSGSNVVPWVCGTHLDTEKEDFSVGGFVTKGDLQRMTDRGSSNSSNQPSQEEIKAAAIQLLLRLGLIKPQASQTPFNDGPTNPVTQEPTQISGQGQAEGDNAPQPNGSDKPNVWDGLPQAKFDAGATILAHAFSYESLNPSHLVKGMSGALASMGANFVLGQAIGKILPLDAESSTAEYAVAKLGPKLIQELVSGSLSGNYAKFLPTSHGPYETLALRVDDIDNNGNPILKGCPKVLIEGMPAARSGDAVSSPGNKLTHGAAKVLIGGKYAARQGDTATDVTGFTMCAPMNAVKTYIGGLSSNPAPPVPQQFIDAGFTVPPNNEHPIADPTKPMPEDPTLFWDPDPNNPEIGEWRPWAGTKGPRTGWGATLSEYYNNTWGADMSDSWKLDSQSTKWYNRLPFIVDFGTPQYPGAGNGSIWFIPDKLFGADIARYYRFHDWLFSLPKDPKHWLDYPLFGILNVEWPAFKEGVWHRSSLYPIQLASQVLASGATTIVGLTLWWDNFLQGLDEQMGFPDQYGQYPHIRSR